MRFCVHKSIIGTEEHLVWSDGRISFAGEIPHGIWLLGPDGNLETLAALNATTLSTILPPEQLHCMKRLLGSTFNSGSIPWRFVLQRDQFKDFLRGLLESIKGLLEQGNTSYYTDVFLECSSVFESLSSAILSVDVLEAHLAATSNPSLKSTLLSFASYNGVTPPVRYDRLASKTGRLTVASGPQILTLKRSCRDIITSRYPGGRVMYCDYRALETRAMLTLVGRAVTDADPYEEISRIYLGDAYPRSTVKLVTLANLYGSTVAATAARLARPISEVTLITSKLNELFDVNSLRLKLRTEWMANKGIIRNGYGRALRVEDESTLVNYFVQSTSVDIALLGFSQIITRIKNETLDIIPLFVLHDALIIDVHPRHMLHQVGQ